MKSLTASSPRWTARATTGLMLVCVLGQMPVQAAEDVPGTPTDNLGPIIVSNDRIKLPHKHRKVVRAPVKPETPATRPQQPVGALR